MKLARRCLSYILPVVHFHKWGLEVSNWRPPGSTRQHLCIHEWSGSGLGRVIFACYWQTISFGPPALTLRRVPYPNHPRDIVSINVTGDFRCTLFNTWSSTSSPEAWRRTVVTCPLLTKPVCGARPLFSYSKSLLECVQSCQDLSSIFTIKYVYKEMEWAIDTVLIF